MDYSTLHQYQKNIVNFLWTHPHAVLSVDMGLGKTLSCLVFQKSGLGEERNTARMQILTMLQNNFEDVEHLNMELLQKELL